MPSATPDPTTWFADLLKLNQDLWRVPGAAPESAPWMSAMNALTAWQRTAWQQLAAPWSALMPGLAATPAAGLLADPAKDRRFGHEAWRQDPRFDIVARAYLAQTEMLQKALEAAPIDERSKARWDFMVRQVADAISPANCLATNPEALQLAMETGGASLAEGMKLFVQDLAKGRISMTDDSAFEVGVNVGTSPGRVVFENELMQLIQYAPKTEKVHARPLLIVPPCINKYYILDLQPENSFVGHAVAEGHTVFLISWRNAGPQQSTLTWDDYLEQGVMRGIDVALAISGADKLNTLGFCIGGTLLASTLAVQAARGEKRAASMTLLTAMLDFSDTGELGLLVSEQSVAQREAAIGQGGLLKGSELAQVFAALRSNDLIWPYVVNGYLKGKAPPPFDLLYWNSDGTNLPGPMFCWYLRNTYLENKLREPGATVQCGEPVDFGRIDVPAFLYASREDHIVPWRTAYASSGLLGGDTRFVLGASGHIAGVINPPAKKKRNYWVNPAAGAAEADAWLDGAQSVPGSWWPLWSDWLASHAGAMVAAPESPGSKAFPAGEDAPGSYVKAAAP